MNKSVIVACLCVGIPASSAVADDIAIRGNASESLSASDNYFLSNTPIGTTAKSLSTINLDFLAATRSTRYLLESNFSYFRYFGAGAEESGSRSGTPAGATFRVDHTTEIDKYYFSSSFNRVDLATRQLTESGIVNAGGFADTYRIGGGVTHDLSRTDSITWSATGTSATFTDSTQSRYVELATTATWNHLLSPTTTLTTSASFDWLDTDDIAKSQRLFWQILTGLQTRLSNRLTFNGSVGVGFVNAYQRTAFLPTVTTSQPGASESLVGNFGLAYQLSKTTRVSLTGGESFVPTTLGQIQKISTVGFVVNHDINHYSNLAFSTQLAHNVLDGIPSDFFSAQVRYGYHLTPEWRADLSYAYLRRNDFTGLAQSSTIMLALTRDFTLSGNPGAWRERDSETERARERARAVQVFPGLP